MAFAGVEAVVRRANHLVLLHFGTLDGGVAVLCRPAVVQRRLHHELATSPLFHVALGPDVVFLRLKHKVIQSIRFT